MNQAIYRLQCGGDPLRGLHSFEGFRKRILLTCGKLRLSKDSLSVLEDARNGKEIRL